MSDTHDTNILAAHGNDPQFRHWLGVDLPDVVKARGHKGAGEWREPRVTPRDHEGHPQRSNYRSCGYCGSVHPEDLLRFIESGNHGHAEMADRKYGYPHKLYVDLPNPLAGQLTVTSWSTEMVDGINTGRLIPGEPTAEPELWSVTFYTTHLQGLPDEQFVALATWIERMTGYHFERRDDGMYWKFAGFAKTTVPVAGN